MRLLTYLFFLVAVALFFGSCKPDDEKLSMSPSLRLSFDRDSVIFDTVFVQTGSVTKRLWVYNNDKNAVDIERIELARASGHQYSLIINGQETNAVNNLRLRGDDSMLVLVKVSIDPNNNLQPFLVTDSITFRTNGNLQDVKLVAYGQNAYFHLPGYLRNCSAIWDTLKPHVIYGAVGVPSGCTLTIQAGAKIYAHSGSGIVVEGTLKVEGTPERRVVFRGDRREIRYDDDRHPGQWFGIVFNEGLTTESTIEYADLENPVVGVYLNPNNQTAHHDLVMRGCFVKNTIYSGLMAFNANVKAENCIFTNSAEAAVGTYFGGNYLFNYCTITNYGTVFNHDKASAHFEARSKDPGTGLFSENPLKLQLYNSIVWGSFKDEILIVPNTSATPVELSIVNNIIRTEAFKTQLEAENQISQTPGFPEFRQPNFLNFKPDSARSPAINQGINIPSLPPVDFDIFGNQRPWGGDKPDLGAIEVEDEI